MCRSLSAKQRLNRVVFGHERSHAWEAAVALLESAELSIVAYTSILSACGKAQQWQLVLQLLPVAQRRRLQLDAVAFNAVLAALARAGKGQECQKMMGGAGGRWGGAQGSPEHKWKAKVAQRIIAYNTTIVALGNESLWQQAISVLESMPRQRLKPTLASWLGGLSALRRVAHWSHALQLLLRRQPVDIASFNACLAVCQAAAQWEVALEVCKGRGLDLVGLNTLLAAFAGGSEWQRSLHYLARQGLDVISFNSALSALAAARCWDHALALLESMQDPMPNVVSYNTAISSCADGEGEEWWHALALFVKMKSAHLVPDLITFNTSMAVGGWRAALQLLEELGSMADSTSYSTALSSLGSAWKWRQCLALLETMEVRNLQQDLLVHLVAWQALAAAAPAPLLANVLRRAVSEASSSMSYSPLGGEALMQYALLARAVASLGGDYLWLVAICDHQHAQTSWALKGASGQLRLQVSRLRDLHLEGLLCLPDVAVRPLLEVRHLRGQKKGTSHIMGAWELPFKHELERRLKKTARRV
ncbi:unnamed protein product [Durusdinium trenchii]|uniref:Pentatricopeptide repeat-containing protein, chloroplastic n=1 Tax=Durusdinium trenchii TaxID=1381693 RepID=A0ABP0HD83_9DINO